MKNIYHINRKAARNIMAIAFIALLPSAAIADNDTNIMGGQANVTNAKMEIMDEVCYVAYDLNLSNTKFKNHQSVALTPVITSSDGNNSVRMKTLLVNGRSQQIANTRKGHIPYAKKLQLVKRNNGKEQILHYSDTVALQPWMKDNSKMALHEDLCGCGNIKDENEYNLTSNVLPTLTYLSPAVEGKKEREVHGEAFLNFPVNQTAIYADYMNNPKELAKIMKTVDVVKNDKNTTITAIGIHGYASPESPYEHNKYLAEHRATALKEYVNNYYKFNDNIFDVSSTPENWDGLRNAVDKSNLANREEILKLISDSTLQPDKKEAAIKAQYPDTYKQLLKDVYPGLRRSDYVVRYTVRPFSVEEAREIIKVNPNELSLQEMYMVAQSYPAGSEAFNNTFRTAAHLYPNDTTANLNAGIAELRAKNYTKASEYLSKAGSSEEAASARKYLEMVNK